MLATPSLHACHSRTSFASAIATGQSWVRSSLTRVRSSSTRQDSRGSRPGEHRRPMSRLNAPSDSFLMGCPSNRHRSVSLYRGCVDLGRRRLGHSSALFSLPCTVGYTDLLLLLLRQTSPRCCRLMQPPFHCQNGQSD